MPQIFTLQPEPQVMLGIWQIEESESFFLDKMPLLPSEEADLAPLKGIRRLEWLACRFLLHEISGHDIRMPLIKDAWSKPFFPETEQRFCSLSHSHGSVAAMISPRVCGCDLQKKVDKMARLAPRVLNEAELAWISDVSGGHVEAETDWFHLFWSAKESLYKAWGKKELDFRAHLWLSFAGSIGEGGILKGAEKETYQVFFKKLIWPNEVPFFLTWCL